MHYYKFNIKDWTRDTAHLSVEEEGVYRRLLDHYYETESPIPQETQPLIRRLRLAGHEQSLQIVLGEFFALESDGYHQSNCDKQIAAYHAKADTNRANGKRGGRPLEPKENPVGSQEKATGNLNHKPITNNQEPLTSKSTSLVADAPAPKKKAAALGVDFLVFNGADEQHAADWLKARKAPLTATAWAAVEREASKAGITAAMAVQVSAENSWRGFRADWYANSRGNHGSHQQDHQRVDNSAVGRVRRAIAEGQAREAGTEPMRHFEPQDGGDLRAPLDGEFRRED